MNEQFDAGQALFKREPELLGIEVWWYASERIESQQGQHDFVAGYMTGRRQHDEYEREKDGPLDTR